MRDTNRKQKQPAPFQRLKLSHSHHCLVPVDGIIGHPLLLALLAIVVADLIQILHEVRALGMDEV